MAWPPGLSAQEAGRRGARMRWQGHARRAEPVPPPPPRESATDPERTHRLDRVRHVPAWPAVPSRCWACGGLWRAVETGVVCRGCARTVVVAQALPGGPGGR